MATSPRVTEAVALYKEGKKAEAIALVSTVIREDRKDEGAWYTLGVMVDDPVQKRQAFETALKINPENVRAQAALQKLNNTANGTTTSSGNAAPNAGGASSGRTSSAGSTNGTGGGTGGSGRTTGNGAKPGTSGGTRIDGQQILGTTLNTARRGASTAYAVVRRAYINGFKLPIVVEGAPVMITGPDLAAQIPPQLALSQKILTTTDTTLQTGTSVDATWWDAIFPAISASVIFALTTAVGLFIRNLVRWFVPRSGVTLGAILISPLFAGAVSAAAAGGAFALGVWGASVYLETQGMKIAWREHTLYSAQVWLPIIVLLAGMRLIGHVLFGFIGTGAVYPLATIAAFALAAFGMVRLSKTFGSMYGETNSRHLIIAAITVFVSLFAMLLFLAIAGTLFRVPLL